MTVPALPQRVPLGIKLTMLTPDQGGKTMAVGNGFRPLCHFASDDAQPVGLCELQLVGRDSIDPGQMADAVLHFDAVHRGLLQEITKVGTLLALAEGARIFARAVVTRPIA